MRPSLFSLPSGSDFEISLLVYRRSSCEATFPPRTQGTSLAINGVSVSRLQDKYDSAFSAEVPQPVADGTLKSKEEEEFEGLQRVGDAILAVQQGTNKTKAVIRVAGASGVGHWKNEC
ncbi:hypothetical protein FA13DRAFT_1712262 [Coprinellus micaceus]|uniref:Uncharacterized protein n=1 Tax=Coprinellus micaceus TaxID=71717 RepID=A0A4Y7T199_COPMI|nr:hypothetical protein FA13DRAFT_1712262 [Coprinellus micaceus]